jgi:cathepsin B
VEAMSDRICITSKGAKNFHISAEDLVDCCIACGFGCNGGYPESAWEHYVRTGLVTGGNYNSNEGCEPYTIASCDHHVNGLLLLLFFCSLSLDMPKGLNLSGSCLGGISLFF